MSLQDPKAKMSKSDPDPRSRILVLDDPDTINARLKAAVTDSGSEVRFDWEQKPGITNLIEIMSLFTGRTTQSIEDEYGSSGYGKFKPAVAEAVIEGLAPIREAFAALDDSDVERVVREGAAVARERAEEFQKRVRERVGLGG
jgi:tryptophanyl-tRNA synthetase